MSATHSPCDLEALRIDVAALRRRGESHAALEVDLPIEWLAATLADTDAEVRQAGRVELNVSLPTDGPVIVSGTLHTDFVVPCGRCLEDAKVDGGTRFEALFVLGNTTHGGKSRPVDPDDDEDGLSLDEDALDTWSYDGSHVDATQVISEYVKVAYPMRALCELGEACQGLCSGCGNNFNEIAPRLAGKRAFCVKCDQEFFGPVGEPAEEGEDGDEPPRTGALADALRKLQLPD